MPSNCITKMGLPSLCVILDFSIYHVYQKEANLFLLTFICICAINHFLHFMSSRDSEEQTLNDFQILCLEPKGKFLFSSPIFSAKSGVFPPEK